MKKHSDLIWKSRRSPIIRILLFGSEEIMRKQTIQYTSSLDALVAVTKRLSVYENQRNMDSEAFFDQYSQEKVVLGFVASTQPTRAAIALYELIRSRSTSLITV